MSRAGVTWSASYFTAAVPVIRLTTASRTPCSCLRARCTRDWHAAHVIPLTGKTISFSAPAPACVATRATSTQRNQYTPLPYVKPLLYRTVESQRVRDLEREVPPLLVVVDESPTLHRSFE